MKRRPHLGAALAVSVSAALVTMGLAMPVSAVPPTPAPVAHNFASPLVMDPTDSEVGKAWLGEGCTNALTAPNGESGLGYTITGTSDTTTVTINRTNGSAAVSNCTDKMDFTISSSNAAPCATVTVTFWPVIVNGSGKVPKGQQSKVQETTLTVNITGTDCDGTGGDEEPVGERPAAPAVANAYINGSPGGFVWTACQDKYKKVSKLWRGALIKEVADLMPKPQSIKDDPDYFEDASDWIEYVVQSVDALCTGDGVAFVDPRT